MYLLVTELATQRQIEVPWRGRDAFNELRSYVFSRHGTWPLLEEKLKHAKAKEFTFLPREGKASGRSDWPVGVRSEKEARWEGLERKYADRKWGSRREVEMALGVSYYEVRKLERGETGTARRVRALMPVDGGRSHWVPSHELAARMGMRSREFGVEAVKYLERRRTKHGNEYLVAWD